MTTLRIVTDSTADVPAELVEQYGIEVVPLALTIGEETMPDGTLTQEEFFARMNAADRLPTTSQPSVGAFREVYERALETASEIVSVHISEHLSGTISSAREAASYFGGRVHVVDSLNLSMGLGWQVIHAARDAAAGLSAAEIVARVEELRERVQLIVGVDSLTNLAKGGRIGKVAAFLGGVLNMRVTFCVENGTFQPVARVRGAQAALDSAMKWMEERMAGRTRGRFCVMHAMAREKAEWLCDAIRERYEVVELIVVETGTVIATHTGSGFGLSFIPLD
jgi:DegV family protein with EDD domain